MKIGLKIALALLLFCTASFAERDRVVGYYEPWLGNYDRFSEVTHVMYAFVANGGDNSVAFLDGNLDDLRQVRDRAHAQGAKVMLSIGGATGQSVHNMNVEVFAEHLADLIVKEGLDGADIDWEGLSAADQPKIAKLAQLLRKQLPRENGFLLSAAVFGSNWNGQHITDAAVAELDFLNIMAYDEWYKESPNHSSKEWALFTLNYWHQTRKVPKEKLVLGLPFYGRPTNKWSAIDWRDARITLPFVDEFRGYYFNGPDMIRDKCWDVVEGGYGGVMVWALQRDKSEESGLSLLSAINEVIPVNNPEYQKPVALSRRALQATPGTTVLRADSRGATLNLSRSGSGTLHLFNSSGEVTEVRTLQGEEGPLSLEWSEPLRNGSWYLKWQQTDGTTTRHNFRSTP